jgi:hypothetical protein
MRESNFSSENSENSENQETSIRNQLTELSEEGLRRLRLLLEDPDTTAREIKEITFGTLDRVGYSPKSTLGIGSGGGGEGALASSVAAGVIEGALVALAKLTGAEIEPQRMRVVSTFAEEAASAGSANCSPCLSPTHTPTPSPTPTPSGLKELAERDRP